MGIGWALVEEVSWGPSALLWGTEGGEGGSAGPRAQTHPPPPQRGPPVNGQLPKVPAYGVHGR